MKQSMLTIALAAISVFASAAAPKWYMDVSAVYPSAKYIARQGNAASIDEAQSYALGQIAQFFRSQVTVNTAASSTMQQKDDQTQVERGLQRQVGVYTQVDLAYVQYSDPFFVKKEKQYYVVAYLDRELYWQALEPKIRQAKAKYDSAIAFADKASGDTLSRFLYLNRAAAAADELSEVAQFGFVVYPSARAQFEPWVLEATQNFDIADNQNVQIPLHITAEGDYEDVLKAALAETFAGFGFMSVKAGGADVYELRLAVDLHAKAEEDFVSVFPALTVALTDASGRRTYVSWQKNYGKTTNFSVEKAQKKAYAAIAPDMQAGLKAAFTAKFY